jgi:hypothetical protein
MSQNRMELGIGVENDVEHPGEIAEIHHDKQPAHDDGCDGQELAQDGDPAESLVVVEVVGQNHHHTGRGHAHKIGELADVKTPGHIPAHPGDSQTLRRTDKGKTRTRPQ